MSDESPLPVVRNNPKHYRTALEAASWVVFSDDKVRGVPSIRDMLAKTAALAVLGHESRDGITGLMVADANRVVVESCYTRAKAAAKDAIFPLGPIKRKLI